MPNEETPDPNPELDPNVAAIAAALHELTEEIKAMHNTLKAIARSQALLATKQQGKTG